MRIGFDGKRATHNFRGLGNYSRGIIEGLRDYHASEELYIYSPKVKDQRGKQWIDSLSANVNFKYPETFLASQLSSFWRSFLLDSQLKNDCLDIFHGLSHEIPYGLSGTLPFKKIVTMHDLIFLRYPEFFPLLDRIVYTQKFKYACKNSDMVMAICEQTKRDLISFLGVDEKKIVVHYQSCSPFFYQSLEQCKLDSIKDKYKIKNNFILNVGAFEERKNQLNLLEAFSQISNKINEDLVFVGQGKIYKDKVKKRITELKLNDRVFILESVPFEDLPALYQAANVFCFPSLFEGFGIPIIESLFSKTAVITSHGSCFPESAGPDSFFIDPLSCTSIADGLLKVLSDTKLQHEMSESGLKFVQRFHLRETTKNLIDFYHQVLS